MISCCAVFVVWFAIIAVVIGDNRSHDFTMPGRMVWFVASETSVVFICCVQPYSHYKPWPGLGQVKVNMARLYLRTLFGQRTYKMADQCILLWFIYFFLLKKRNRRKYRINSALQINS